jgi:pantothenate kinase
MNVMAEARALIAQARASPSRRVVLGITGEPGAGKSTLAEELVAELGDDAVLVGMDGYHLSNAVLRNLELLPVKGAPATFDAHGYVALLERLAANREPVVYAPRFHREIEESIAAEIVLPQEVPLVVTEGIYLLLEDEPWARVRELLTAVWYVEVPQEVRIERLLRRHEAFGRTPEEARAHGLGSDERNAELIRKTRYRADQIVEGE